MKSKHAWKSQRTDENTKVGRGTSLVGKNYCTYVYHMYMLTHKHKHNKKQIRFMMFMVNQYLKYLQMHID